MADNEETSQDSSKHRPWGHEGRLKIYSSAESITMENVEKVVVSDTLPKHLYNSRHIRFLWLYYKGRQPVLDREKKSRPEICNRIVENHAQEAVQFKVGYQFAEPLQYIPRSDEDDEPSGHEDAEDALVNKVRALNDLCYAEDKASSDRDLFEWMCICGVGYRMVEVIPEAEREDGDAPFRFYTLDPRRTYVIYSDQYHHKPLGAVYLGWNVDKREWTYNVYTPQGKFTKKPGEAWVYEEAVLGINIFEYELNNARMGVFEPALPLLDAINTIESNRVDGVEQAVQALMVFDNVDIDADGFDKMREKGALKTISREGCTGKVYSVSADLNQSEAQTTKDDLYTNFTNIVGMPRQGSSGGGGDTGSAVMLRDGWTLAESHAKSYELKWKKAERCMLRCLLDIVRTQTDEKIDLRLRDIELTFNRRQWDNTLVKAQTLTTMLSEDRIDPELAFESCGLFTDPTSAYLQSKAHYEQVQEENQQRALEIAGRTAQETGDISNGGVAAKQEKAVTNAMNSTSAEDKAEKIVEKADSGNQGGGDNEHNEAVKKVAQQNKVAEQSGAHPRG